MKKYYWGVGIAAVIVILGLVIRTTELTIKTPSGEKILTLIAWALLCLFFGAIAIFLLAKADLFFTFTEEGSAKAILNMGAFSRIIMQFKGFKLDEDSNVVPDTNYKKRILGGLRWLGIPFIQTLYEYTFRWTTVRPQTGEVIKRSEKIDYIYVRDDVYVIEIKGAESEGMVPLDITLLLTICSINPYKSLFKAQDWNEMIFNRSEASFREYVAQHDFKDLIKQKQAAGGELYKKLEDQGLLKEFIDRYGVNVKAVEMKNVTPAGEHAKLFEEAATKEWQAKREQERIETIAKAEVNRINRVYSQIEKFGELGTAVRFMESLDKAGEKPGNWIIPFGDVRTALQGIFGKKGEK